MHHPHGRGDAAEHAEHAPGDGALDVAHDRRRAAEGVPGERAAARISVSRMRGTLGCGPVEGYPHRREITTRWMDNDVYGHVNNVQYYSYFDTVINEYLITEGGLDIAAGPVIGAVRGVALRLHGALAFPETVEAWLRVAHLGRSSVRYEIALRRAGAEEPAARAGSFTSSSTARRGGRRRSPRACAARWRRCSSSRRRSV